MEGVALDVGVTCATDGSLRRVQPLVYAEALLAASLRFDVFPAAARAPILGDPAVCLFDRISGVEANEAGVSGLRLPACGRRCVGGLHGPHKSDGPLDRWPRAIVVGQEGSNDSNARSISMPEHDKHEKTVTIVVDGTPHQVPKNEYITYAEVVTLAYPDYPQHPEITYSVTYTRGHGEKPEGILNPGESVKVKKGVDSPTGSPSFATGAGWRRSPRARPTPANWSR